jgi:hypothetical protein
MQSADADDADFRTRVRQTVEVFATIMADERKAGDVPCPRCGRSILFWKGKGPRALRMACETTGCIQALS